VATVGCRSMNTGPVRGVLCPSVIGRDDELEAIGEALDGAAESSRGRVLFVAGEAGIGKSRLAQEAIVRARLGRFSVLTGRATIPHSTVAFRPLTEALFSHFRDQGPPDLPELEPFHGALARLVPEWRRGDGSGTDDSIVVVAEAVVRLLRAVGRPTGCLLVLDDLHWADPETLSIVEYLAENLVAEPVVCLCTVRSEEASAALGLAHALAARRAAAMITLSRLATADTTAMALACLSAPDLPDSVETLLSQSADGLPFFVEELLAGAIGSGALIRGDAGWTVQGTLEPDVPRTFLDSVEGRLRAMGEAADVLVAAAVIGRRFDWTLLSVVTGRPEKQVLATLRAGVDAQLLVAEPSPTGSFRFRHSLTRDAVIQRLLPMEGALLARVALDAIEAAHPGLPDAWCDLGARLAERAGDRSKAAGLLLESGRRSRARGALASAEEAFSRAGELASDVPPLAADAAEALCEALSLSGKVDRALEVGAELFTALLSLEAPPERAGRVHLWLARAAATVARWDVADDHAGRARVCAEAADDLELSASVDAIGAAIALVGGDIERASELAQRAKAVAEQLGLHEVTCEALEMIGRAARVHDIGQAEAALTQALAVADEHGLEVWRVRALFELGSIDLLRSVSLDRLRSARELAMAGGALAVAAHVDMMLAFGHCDRFELDEAQTSARRAAEVARRFGMQSLHALTLLGEAAVDGWRGRLDDMEAGIDDAFSLAGNEHDVAGVGWMLCRGVAALIQENRDRAEAAFDAGMEALRPSASSAPMPQRGLWALVRAVDGLDGDAACAEVRGSGVLVHCMNRGNVHYAEAVLAGRRGEKEAAGRLVAAGDNELATVPWFRALARRLMAEAAIADGWGDPATWLREALVCFEERGQERLVTACRSLLGKAGAPVPRRRQDSHVPTALRQIGVTEREYEVLTLLAEGLANKEIAARLFMSPRTVERHVANITVKAGLRTRSELVAFAARNADAPRAS
jgi:DNA-binding CsgD family transcriptional regulator/tetratricopeptide (TPR) repeat protein